MEDARRDVVEFLVSQGVTQDEIETAERDGRLGSILTDRIAGTPTLTLADVAARAGQSPELIARVWRAAGLSDPEPDSPAFSESDAEALAVFGMAVQLFGEEPTLQLVRVVGSAMARVAEAQLSTVLANVEGAYFPTAASPLEAMRTSATLNALAPAGEQAIGHLLRRHLAAANRRFEATRPLDAGVEVLDVAIGFADLSGSTALSVELPWAEFARAMARFESEASDVVTAEGGRVVKLIGDEIMFVAPGLVAGCRIGLALLDALADDPVLPGLRVGLAAGHVTARDGDYFGPVVHLASRLVDLAPPGALVIPGDLAEQVASVAHVTDTLGRQTLRGFPQPVTVVRVAGGALLP
jgi:class 3 adenylate cyclase